MKYLRKKKILDESNWFERFPTTDLKQNIINLISNKAGEHELFVNSSYNVPMKYYISCGGYNVEELIADALSLSNRKHSTNTEISEQGFSDLDGVYTYNSTNYNVEIKSYYEKPSAKNKMFTDNQLRFLRSHRTSSLAIICQYKINEIPNSGKKIFIINKVNVLYGSEI